MFSDVVHELEHVGLGYTVDFCAGCHIVTPIALPLPLLFPETSCCGFCCVLLLEAPTHLRTMQALIFRFQTALVQAAHMD